jgi:hypothetical protein
MFFKRMWKWGLRWDDVFTAVQKRGPDRELIAE